MVRSAIDVAEAQARAAEARRWLGHCELCQRRCGVDRLAGQRGYCNLSEESLCFKRHVSFAEEAELLPSYMIYFAGCNLRCQFCIQAPRSFAEQGGESIDAATLAGTCVELIDRGVKTINLVGGEPSLHLHTILSMASEAGREMPWVLNSNMLMSRGVLDLLDGVISLYLADFKFGNDGCARAIADADDYVGTVTANLTLAATQGEVLIRHLLLPGHLECCFQPVAQWAARNLPGARFHLMGGYVPAPSCGGAIRATVQADELAEARRILDRIQAQTPMRLCHG